VWKDGVSDCCVIVSKWDQDFYGAAF